MALFAGDSGQTVAGIHAAAEAGGRVLLLTPCPAVPVLPHGAVQPGAGVPGRPEPAGRRRRGDHRRGGPRPPRRPATGRRDRRRRRRRVPAARRQLHPDGPGVLGGRPEGSEAARRPGQQPAPPPERRTRAKDARPRPSAGGTTGRGRPVGGGAGVGGRRRPHHPRAGHDPRPVGAAGQARDRRRERTARRRRRSGVPPPGRPARPRPPCHQGTPAQPDGQAGPRPPGGGGEPCRGRRVHGPLQPGPRDAQGAARARRAAAPNSPPEPARSRSTGSKTCYSGSRRRKTPSSHSSCSCS